MPKETLELAAAQTHREAGFIERVMLSDIGGIPVALVVCAIAAVVFGGLVAVTAGSH